jgi:hypothetical protein
MDINTDGFVSYVEWLIYVLTHRTQETAQSRQASADTGQTSSYTGSYDSTGAAAGVPGQTRPLVDLFA